MADSKLNILVQVKDEASAALGRLSSDIGDLGGNLAFASEGAGGLASAISAIGAGAEIAASVQAFADAETTMNNFDAIIRSLPPSLQTLRGEIMKHAEDATYMGFSNEEAALSMAKLLKVLGNGPDTFKAFDAVMGVAILHHEGLSEATKEVILGMEGMGKSFKEDGIVVDAHLSKQQNLANIYKVAKTALDNYSDSTQHAINEISEFGNQGQQAIGGQFSEALKAAAQTIETFIQAHGGMAKTMEEFQPIITAVSIILATLFVTGMVVALAATLALIGPFGLVIAAVLAIAGVATLAYTIWALYWPKIKDLALGAWEGIKNGLKSGWDWMVTNIFDPFTKKLDSLIEKLKNMWDLVKSTASSLGGGIKSAVSSAGHALGINDGIVQNGNIITTHPDDFIIATKTPGSLGRGGGGGGITINFNGDVLSPSELTDVIQKQMAFIIKNQLNLSGIHA